MTVDASCNYNTIHALCLKDIFGFNLDLLVEDSLKQQQNIFAFLQLAIRLIEF
jgi:hypothetical protein